jgi:hypothetical protein
MMAAVSSGFIVEIAIPDPNSNPAIVVTRGIIWRCQR